MTIMREWMRLCEVQVGDDIVRQAAQSLISQIDWSGGGGETVLAMMGYDPYNSEEVDHKSAEFQQQLLTWAADRINDVLWEIENQFEGDTITVYRMITAPPNWQPDPNMHPGQYWSWDEDAADAHWGDFSQGNVKWLMMADVQFDQIDWVQTLAVNGMPDQEDEREITLLPNVPVKILKYWRAR